MKRTFAGLAALGLVLALSAPALAGGLGPDTKPAEKPAEKPIEKPVGAPVTAQNGAGTFTGNVASLVANQEKTAAADKTKDKESKTETKKTETTYDPRFWPPDVNFNLGLVIEGPPPGKDVVYDEHGWTVTTETDSGHWQHIAEIKYWQWTFSNSTTGASWTRQTPKNEIDEPITEPGTYVVTAVPWVRWEYGHYVRREVFKADLEKGDLGRIITTHRAKDGEREGWDENQRAKFQFTLSTDEVPGKIHLPQGKERVVIPIDELIR